MNWELLKKEDVFENNWRRVQSWHMKRPDGNVAEYFIQCGKDIVVVFGLRDDGQVLVLREYYIAQQKKVWSLVAGIVDYNNPEASARAELQEEAGCVARAWTHLGSSFRGKYEEGNVHYYLAEGVKFSGGQQLEPSEDIDPSFMPVESFLKLLRTCELQDVSEVACAYRAMDHLGLL